MSRRSGSPGLERGESRGWGRRAPQSPPSPLFGAPARSNKIYRSDEVFLIEEARRNPQSQTSIPYKKTKEISQLLVKQAENAGGQSGQVPITSRPQVNQAQRQWQKSRVLFHHHQPDLFLGGAAAVHDAGDLAAAEHQNAVAQLDENVQVLAHIDDGDALFLLLV